MVYFYQLFLNTDDVILKLYTSLCQKAKCTLFVWSTVHNTLLVMEPWKILPKHCISLILQQYGVSCWILHDRCLQRIRGNA